MHDQPEQASADVRDLPEIEQDIVRLNKPLLLAALAAAGADTATVAYSYCVTRETLRLLCRSKGIARDERSVRS